MPIKLAIFTQELGWGGVERTVSNLSLYLPDENTIKYLIVYGNKIIHEHKGKLIKLNPHTFYRSSNPLLKAIGIFKMLRDLKKYKKDLGIDITISMPDVPNLNNILSRVSDKVIISVRTIKSHPDCDNVSFYSFMINILIRIFYNKADLIIANSQGVKRDLIRRFGIKRNKIEVIYNMLNVELIQKSSREDLDNLPKNLLSNNKILISVGRLSKEKGQWHLLKIFKSIKESVPDAKLMIVGDGELRDHLIALAEKLGFKVYSVWSEEKINENYDVYFLGFQKNPFNFIAKSCVFLLPSTLEGFPNVLTEAMACGIPVVAADCMSGPREILAPDTDFMFETKCPEFAKYGILMPVCDRNVYDNNDSLSLQEQSWAVTVIKLLEDKDMRQQYSILARTRASDFSVEKVIGNWQKTIDRFCRIK